MVSHTTDTTTRVALQHTQGPLLSTCIIRRPYPFKGELRGRHSLVALRFCICDYQNAYKRGPYYLQALLQRPLVVTHLRLFACLDHKSHTMAPQTCQQSDVVHAKNEKQQETSTSLDPDVDYKAWKPDRNVKMALAVQTSCVVRQIQSAVCE